MRSLEPIVQFTERRAFEHDVEVSRFAKLARKPAHLIVKLRTDIVDEQCLEY